MATKVSTTEVSSTPASSRYPRVLAEDDAIVVQWPDGPEDLHQFVVQRVRV